MKIVNTCLGMVLAILASTASAGEFHMSWSGWSRDSNEADTNGDLEGGGTSHLVGRGVLGRAESAASYDSLPWDGSTFCDFNETGQPEGILLYTVAATEIARAASGDLLYRKIASSPPSTVCFNFVNSVATVELYYQITGGTGRFREATGETVLRMTVDVQQGINGAHGTEEGHMRVSRSHKKRLDP